jgi:pimeloyl-ACP methyl ester carboxylesterase
MTDMRLVQANGIRLAYRESGPASAPPLLLLHAAQPARFTSAVAVFLAGSKGPPDPPA